jgi:ATP-dependent helicase HrpB
VTRLGAIIFDETPLQRPSRARRLHARLPMACASLGLPLLPFSKEAAQLRERIGFLYRRIGAAVAGHVGDEALSSQLDDVVHSLQTRCARFSDDINAVQSVRTVCMSLVPHDNTA